MNGYLQPEAKAALEELVGHCFYCNRMIDRMMSILSVKFVMPNSESILHPNIAHWYPAISDLITEYMDGRDSTTIYPATPIGNQDYEDPKTMFKEMLKLNLLFEDKIKATMDLVIEEKDYSTKVFLDSLLLKVLAMTSKIILLVDKAERYGDTDIDMMRFDDDIHNFNLFSKED